MEQLNDGCDAWFAIETKPKLEHLKTYFRKPGEKLGMFLVEQVGNRPIETAIDFVRHDMKTNAMVLIK